jgi:HEAT repeat protein
MAASIDDLIARLNSDDGDTRALALGDLAAQGAQATPALQQALQSPHARVRALAAEGLGMIADPAAADDLAAAVYDSDDKVRARAATALAHIGDPRALDALIRTIEDFTDVLHGEYSLSTYTLMGFGPTALPAVAPLLKAPYVLTRTKAYWIIRKNVTRMLGDDAAWDALWQSLGSYDPKAPEAERNRAADQWTAWITAHKDGGTGDA